MNVKEEPYVNGAHCYLANHINEKESSDSAKLFVKLKYNKFDLQELDEWEKFRDIPKHVIVDWYPQIRNQSHRANGWSNNSNLAELESKYGKRGAKCLKDWLYQMNSMIEALLCDPTELVRIFSNGCSYYLEANSSVKIVMDNYMNELYKLLEQDAD
jgi:hypothetical protein